MAFFEWNDDYSVGVETMDQQHQKLIGLINQLHEALEEDGGQQTTTAAVDELDTIISVLDELVDYSSYHLSTEEDYMREYAYPEYAEHRRTHGQFIDRIQTFKREFDEGEALLSREIIDFLRDWWTQHILKVDKKYGPFFNEKGLT
jgi:hemerythrin